LENSDTGPGGFASPSGGIMGVVVVPRLSKPPPEQKQKDRKTPQSAKYGIKTAKSRESGKKTSGLKSTRDSSHEIRSFSEGFQFVTATAVLSHVQSQSSIRSPYGKRSACQPVA
jgi:hypothetical protein